MGAVELPSHRHPLNRRELLSGGDSRVCGLCGKEVTNESAYECSHCNFTAHLDCAEKPQPLLVIHKMKVHEHPLTLLARHVSFICNACGDSGDKSPYVCLQCAFMIHRDCIDFPRVIKISRHLHRLAHTFFLGPGDWSCGICHRKVDGNYGAYICAKGDGYVAHLKCATKVDVWDGKDLTELKGEPEEMDVYRLPFVVIDDGAIRHFSHEHVLRLLQSNKDMIRVRSGVCSACSFPLDTNRFYTCQQCDYFLHEVCANLPRKKISFLHVHPLTLCTEDETERSRGGGGGTNGLSRCGACDLCFNGFSYRCLLPGEDHVKFDVKCSSVSEPFEYPFHRHPLYAVSGTSSSICTLCERNQLTYSLVCLDCAFTLCFVCATAPHEVNYKYDEHLLSSNIFKSFAIDPYWCDICERKINETRRMMNYKCSECGPVLHSECALGSFRNMRPGFSFVTEEGHKYEVIINDRTSLLRCINCRNDCHEPLLMMSTTTNTTITDYVTIYLCSSTCFDTYCSSLMYYMY